jgi:hypothetical protein
MIRRQLILIHRTDRPDLIAIVSQSSRLVQFLTRASLGGLTPSAAAAGVRAGQLDAVKAGLLRALMQMRDLRAAIQGG